MEGWEAFVAVLPVGEVLVVPNVVVVVAFYVGNVFESDGILNLLASWTEKPAFLFLGD
jgi:hypothetical protein